MIRIKTKSCLDLFQACSNVLRARVVASDGLLDSPHSPDPADSFLTRFKEQTGRFRLWAANIGVTAETRASLDYRLRDAPDVAEMVGSLLDVVSIRLAHISNPLLEYPSDDPVRSPPHEATPHYVIHASLLSQQSETLDALAEDIGRLQRISRAIRRAGGKNIMSRSSGHILKDEDTILNLPVGEERTMVFEVDFLKFVQEVLDRRYPNTDQALREYLASMIKYRRQRLMYAQSHQHKLEENHDHGSCTAIEPSAAKSAAISVENASHEPVPIEGTRASGHASTTASTFDPVRYKEPYSQAPSSAATSQLSMSPHVRGNSDIPPPPQAKDGAWEQRCPYCGWNLPIRDFGKKRWSRHVLHDLEPYICLYEACFQSQSAFSSINDWIAHTYEKHTRSWICPLHKHESDQDGVAAVALGTSSFAFSSRADLDLHLATKHPDISPSKARTLARRSVASDASKVFQSCPFCDWLPSNVSHDSDTMEEHTASHLLSLAMMALPARDDFVAKEGESKQGSMAQNAMSSHGESTKSPTMDLFETWRASTSTPIVADRVLTLHDIQIGWICALPIEAVLAGIMLDELFDQTLAISLHDNNTYVYGRIRSDGSDDAHTVAIAQFAPSARNKTSTAVVVKNMRRTFPNLKFAIIVGIADGIWTEKEDVRLGDVVVGVAKDNRPDFVQYELKGSSEHQGFFTLSSTNKAPDVLCDAVAVVQERHRLRPDEVMVELNSDELKTFAARPDHDNLFSMTYAHQGGTTCRACDEHYLLNRPDRASIKPSIHYGTIASGDQIVKDAVMAKDIQKEHNILCLENEAVGLEGFPCLVIRGICNYVDTHRNEIWHAYAAATASAYAKKLLSVIDVATVTALLPTGNKHWNVPFSSTPSFQGREVLLGNMKQVLLPNGNTKNHPSVFVIIGLGGIGKTQAAIKFAEDARERFVGKTVSGIMAYMYSFWAVFWIDAATAKTIDYGLAKAAEMLVPMLPEPDLETVLQYLQNTRQDWLIIFDGCDDPDLNLSKYFPRGDRGSILITSRVASMQVYGPHGDLDDLGRHEAVQLLLISCGVETAYYESLRPHAEDVVILLEHNPLAIAHAGAFIKRGYCNLEDFCDHYQNVVSRQVQMVSQPSGIYTTLDTCADFLSAPNDTDGRLALGLLNLLAFLDADGASKDIFNVAFDNCQMLEQRCGLTWIDTAYQISPSNSDPDDRVAATFHHTSCILLEEDGGCGEIRHLDAWHCYQVRSTGLVSRYTTSILGGAIMRLADMSLVSVRDDIISVHRLVSEWVRSRLTIAEKQRTQEQVLAILTLSSDKIGEYKSSGAEMRAHMVKCVRDVTQSIRGALPLDIARGLYHLGWQLHAANEITTALLVFKELSERCQISPQTWSARSDVILYSMALSLYDLGKFSETCDIVSQVLDSRNKWFRKKSTEIIEAELLLARASAKTGEWSKVSKLCESLLERIPQYPDLDRSTCLHLLSNAHLNLGHVDQAIPLLEELVKLRSQALGSHHSDTVLSMWALGEAYMRCEDARAIPLFEEAVETQSRSYSLDHPSLLRLKKQLARAYANHGKDEEAIDLLEEVIIRQTALRLPGPLIQLKAVKKLAILHLQNGRPAPAVDLLERVIRLEPNWPRSARLGRLKTLATGGQNAVNLLEQSTESDGDDETISSTLELLADSHSQLKKLTYLFEISLLCQFMQQIDEDFVYLGAKFTPSTYKTSSKPPTLRYLMSPTIPLARLKLGRFKRYEIAAAAAWATFLFGGTPWLDHATATGLLATLDTSILPEPYRSKLTANGAVVALGILLIELCLNRPLDEISKRKDEAISKGITFDDLDSLVDQVYLDAGELYGGACQQCLRLEFIGRDATNFFEHEGSRQNFYYTVVAPIHRTFRSSRDFHRRISGDRGKSKLG